MATKKTASKELYSDTMQRMMAKGFAALGDPNRLKIVGKLLEGACSVGDLRSVVGGSMANVSKHLSILKAAGLVQSGREGTNSFHRMSDTFAEGMIERILEQVRAQQAARVLAMG